MKRLVLMFIFFISAFHLSLAQGNDVFSQDVAMVHGERQGIPAGNVDAIMLSDNLPLARVEGQWVSWDGKQWNKHNAKIASPMPATPQVPPGEKLLSWVEYRNGFAIGCEGGLFISDNKGRKFQKLFPADENYSWNPREVHALAVDSKGNLWAGMKEGVGKFDGNSWKLFTGKEGLPYNEFTCAAPGPNGEVWFGTKIGAIRVEDDYFYYRASRRWLPDDLVNEIVVDKNGTAWLATGAGVSQISTLKMGYEAKADHFIDQVEARHNRMGFICQSDLPAQYDISSSRVDISDNDGLYTAMYGAAMAYRYAVTGDPKARALAVRSFYACKWLVDITHEPGFPARVIIPVDWRDPVNEQYSREYNKRHQQSDPFWKDIYPRFPLSEDGKYRWKCDTSSDELAGHYFYYGVFYDLIAESEQEKADVRQVVADITDHLIRHGFRLVDYDGKPTRWGNFQPEFFNSVWGWEQRGLNSMMMLSFLNVASHVTGDPKYDEVAAMLRDEHQYHINAMHAKEFFPPENAVPWDNNLSLMSLYGLINYEKNPELLIMYRNALENAWLHISKQKNAFWDGLYGALANTFSEKVEQGYFTGKSLFPENPLFASAALERFSKSSLDIRYMTVTLQRIPLDLIGYKVDNTHRLDVVQDPTPGQQPGMGWGIDGYALPIDERGHVRLDRDAFALVYSEGNGFSEHEGTFYLLPYYLAKYHNLIK